MAIRTPVSPKRAQSHIIVTPNVAHGRPRIAGHRIRVQDVAVWHERMGMSPDEIADEYDLTLGEVYAALAYYFDHRKQIQADIERDRKFVRAMKRRTPSKLRPKLKSQRG
jgi:uncharacterized protein (DUF433 family)